MQRISKQAKGGDKEAVLEEGALKKLNELLQTGTFINLKDHFTEDEINVIKPLNLMSVKPVIYCANVSEFDLKEGNNYTKLVEEYASRHGAQTVIICARIEEELVELGEEGAKEYLEELGVKDSGINKMIKSVYDLLNLITFITAGEKEVHAWTITRGTKAPQAAGVIHTDFEKGFIRAEVVEWQTLLECGGLAGAREKGKVRSEGKDYVMKDGDVVLFRFNV